MKWIRTVVLNSPGKPAHPGRTLRMLSVVSTMCLTVPCPKTLLRPATSKATLLAKQTMLTPEPKQKSFLITPVDFANGLSIFDAVVWEKMLFTHQNQRGNQQAQLFSASSEIQRNDLE